MLKITLILLTFNKVFGDSCPFLSVKHENFYESSLKNGFKVYQYKEVDPVVMSPFYGIGDKFTFTLFVQGLIKVSCSYIANKSTNSSVESTDLILNRIRFGENIKDNRIQLDYSENPGDIFCGAVAKMKEIWLIDHSPCYLSLYGCQMAKINGESRKFEGVLILKDAFLSKTKRCSYADLRYTYDVLQNQTGIAQSSLSSGSVENQNMTRNYCQIERDQLNICKAFISDSFDKSTNTVYFVIVTVWLWILFVSFLYEKFVGLDVLM